MLNAYVMYTFVKKKKNPREGGGGYCDRGEIAIRFLITKRYTFIYYLS